MISNTSSVIGASNTSYRSIAVGETGSLSTESNTQITYRTAGILSRLLILVTANDRGNSTFRTRKGGVNGNMVNSAISGTGEFVDNTNTDVVTAGELWNFQLITGAGGTTFNTRMMSVVFSATTNTVTFYSNNNSNTHTINNQTIFMPLSGSAGTNTTTEALAQSKMKTAGVLKNLQAFVLTNTRTTTTTIRSRIGGANGNLNFPVLTTSTGLKEDTSNSDIVVVDNLVNSSITFGAEANNFRLRNVKYEFETTNGRSNFLAGTIAGLTVSAATTYYIAINGSALDTTENDVKTTANVAFTASKLNCYVAANNITADSILRFRADNASLNQVVTITGLVGNSWFEDSSNTDKITITQKINYMLTGGAGGTTLILHNVGMLTSYSPESNFFTFF